MNGGATAAVVRRGLPILVAGALCAVMVVQANWSRRTTSITFDETFYLSCALDTIHAGRLDPRLAAAGAPPLAVFANYLPPLLQSGGERRSAPWRGFPHDSRLIAGPRLFNIFLFGVPLVALVFVWLYRRHGLPAATLGSGLLALSPSVVAHAAVATLDTALAFSSTLALLVLAWYIRRPSWRGLVGLAVAIGAALSAKYSGVYLLAVAGAAFVLAGGASDRSGSPATAAETVRGIWRRLRRAVGSWLVLAMLTGGAWWGFHLFTFNGPLKVLPLEQTSDSSPWVRLFGRGAVGEWVMQTAHERLGRPSPITGLDFQLRSNRRGFSAYFMGQTSRSGWPLYYPAAFAFKSTPAELVLTIVLIGAVVGSLPRMRTSWRRLDPAVQVLVIAAGTYSLLMLTTRINAGHRYLLPLYPLLALLAADRVAAWLPDRRLAQVAVAGALLGAQALSSAGIGPHYLAYFNRLSGGPEQGWQLLSDSNIDWGQDLPALRDFLVERSTERAVLGYFGTADPAGYGITADRLDAFGAPPAAGWTSSVDENLGVYTWLALSVTVLHGQRSQGVDPFRELRALDPHARAGYSIFLYDLRDPQARHAFEAGVARLASAGRSPGGR
jgi:4-amino-4-deoxy-L-arabinose transferase-like glycosyltransferase